jgi:hypothetical protein
VVVFANNHKSVFYLIALGVNSILLVLEAGFVRLLFCILSCCATQDKKEKCTGNKCKNLFFALALCSQRNMQKNVA